jgi:hypothetical protein
MPSLGKQTYSGPPLPPGTVNPPVEYSRFDTVGNQQAQCVDQDVAFASLYALVRVETTSATTLGRLDRLAIRDLEAKRDGNHPS